MAKKNTEKNNTEKYFEWWLDDLKKHELILDWEREPETFVLREPNTVFYMQHFERKPSVHRAVALDRAITYSPDYKVYVPKNSALFGKMIALLGNQMLYNPLDYDQNNLYQETLFYATNTESELHGGCYIFYFDVKPSANAIRSSGSLGSSREFPIKKRLMYEIHNIIVNKVVPVGGKDSLFEKTFLPTRYLFNDSGSAPRKISFKFDDFMKYAINKNIVLNFKK